MTRVWIEPIHVPFFKRDKLKPRYRPTKVSRFVREHTLCGKSIPCARFFVYVDTKSKILSSTQRWRAILFERSFIRRIKPNIIKREFTGVQPMTAPSGQIYTIRLKCN